MKISVLNTILISFIYLFCLITCENNTVKNRKNQNNKSIKHDYLNNPTDNGIKYTKLPLKKTKASSVNILKKKLVKSPKQFNWPKPVFKSKIKNNKKIKIYKQSITYPYDYIRKDYLLFESSIYEQFVPVHVILPKSYSKFKKRFYPYVILFGGASYAVKGINHSVHYWDSGYNMARKYANFFNGTLEFQLNEAIKINKKFSKNKPELTRGFPEDMIIVLPHTPVSKGFKKYKRYFLNELLPVLHKTYRFHAHPSLAGIDGTSHGGALAFEIGFSHPEIFQAIGATQSSIGSVEENVKLTIKNLGKIRNELFVNIITTDNDVCMPRLKSFYEFLKSEKLNCKFQVYKGKHGREFGRELGGYEVLFSYGFYFRNKMKTLFGYNSIDVSRKNKHKKITFKPNQKTQCNYTKTKSWKEQIVLYNLYGKNIPLYKSININKKEFNYKVKLSKKIKDVESGTCAFRLNQSFKKGYRKTSLAEKVILNDGTIGWVHLKNIGIKAEIRRIKYHEFENVHIWESQSSKIIDKISYGEGFYVNALDLINIYKLGPWTENWINILTFRGKSGFINCFKVRLKSNL
jgi:iron(III)-salmochelin esterase